MVESSMPKPAGAGRRRDEVYGISDILPQSAPPDSTFPPFLPYNHRMSANFDVIVIGGGHAGCEAASGFA